MANSPLHYTLADCHSNEWWVCVCVFAIIAIRSIVHLDKWDLDRIDMWANGRLQWWLIVIQPSIPTILVACCALIAMNGNDNRISRCHCLCQDKMNTRTHIHTSALQHWLAPLLFHSIQTVRFEAISIREYHFDEYGNHFFDSWTCHIRVVCVQSITFGSVGSFDSWWQCSACCSFRFLFFFSIQSADMVCF